MKYLNWALDEFPISVSMIVINIVLASIAVIGGQGDSIVFHLVIAGMIVGALVAFYVAFERKPATEEEEPVVDPSKDSHSAFEDNGHRFEVTYVLSSEKVAGDFRVDWSVKRQSGGYFMNGRVYDDTVPRTMEAARRQAKEAVESARGLDNMTIKEIL